ncbi:hypothetical protein N431DRAFT_504404 [Stipitochalara longipes BDJ]|nr:hypothetical protein N431DRAFT_504404 [Stipitochalara longipes BDJ]
MSTVNPVIRRSHTKSKHGCHTCRARRIKCDEFRPHCRNCLLSQRTCKYLITIAAENSLFVPALKWPSTADHSCRRWKDSGEPPFPFLQLPKTPSWHNLSLENLRHMHHLALLASILELSRTRHFCLWWSEFIIFVQLALKFEFVAYAVMAHSAGRLALVTKLSAAFEDAARYRSLAMQGLNQAINSFSKDNADAILCASLCLSDQEPDWRAWKTLMTGTCAVVNEMRPWIKESVFFRFLDFRGCANSERCIDFGNSTIANDGHGCVPILKSVLAQGISSLNGLSSCAKDRPDLSALVRHLRDTCRVVHDRSSNWSVEDQFRLMHPFSAWMNKYTISYIAISEGDPIVLATLAHFFAVVVTLDLAFPDINLLLVSPIRLQSIIEVGRVLRTKPAFFCGSCRIVHEEQDLMAFPLNTVHVYNG